MRAPLATLILLSLLTFTLGLGRQAITDGDEGYYAEAAREMVESGDWLTPHFNYADRWQKPILYYWVTAATFAVSGTSEWGARACAAVSGIALVLLTYAIGRRTLERADAAWLGAAIVATCYGYFALARLALPDLPLALFMTLTVFLWIEQRPALAGLAAGVGFLDKGPLAIVIPAIVLIPIAWREHRWKSGDTQPPVTFRAGDVAPAAGVFLAVAAPWYLAMVAEHGVAYLQSFFISDNLERFATDRFNSPRALWFYVPILLGGIFPWTAFLALPFPRAIAVIRRRAQMSRTEWRLVIWAAAPLLFFTVSIGKQPRYILPVLPPLALLLAGSIAKRLRTADAAGSQHRRGLAVATWTTAAIYLALAILLFRAGPVLINAYPSITLAGVAVLILSAALLAWTAATAQWSTLAGRMCACAVAMLLVLQFGALAGRRPEAVETVASLVRASRVANEAVATYKTLERNLPFYTGLQQTQLYDDQQALAFLDRGERVILVARAQDVLRLQANSHLSLKALGSVDYVDPSAVRLSALLFPSRRDIVTDLMVVSNR